MPPLLTVVPLSRPPASTRSVPPEETVVASAVPPDRMSRTSPPLKVRPELVMPEETKVVAMEAPHCLRLFFVFRPRLVRGSFSSGVAACRGNAAPGCRCAPSGLLDWPPYPRSRHRPLQAGDPVTAACSGDPHAGRRTVSFSYRRRLLGPPLARGMTAQRRWHPQRS
jgi:hypothetical protein